ncbi:MAG: 4-alpha-glucanotransferase [Acidobacteria bacterium]|nr:4-alpha-glucanotransferase [Acidobacteriota bacterium]
MRSRRRSGILLHPTSLPGRFGIGDLGPWAYKFVNFLVESAQSVWQILPLGPPGLGNSPYMCYSSMAGNPMLISLERLAGEGWIAPDELDSAPRLPEDRVDFDAVASFRWALLRKAAQAFFERCSSWQRRDFESFCEDKRSWLDNYASFAALKEAGGESAWPDWPKEAAPPPSELLTQKFVQYEFFRQWRALRSYCADRGIEIIGDLPIFVAHNSDDVWAHPELFDLDEKGYPRTIAGVPPDYFSSTGQCWGNPLYRWDVMEQTGYAWWIERIRAMLELVDVIRIDHFRGFEKYWEIPGDATTAQKGRWVDGPGDRFFAALEHALGRLPFIAEDLGYITPEVHALRDRWGFPGMRVLQFSFCHESADDPFKPYNFIRNCVVYTGTHDNDTTLGWFNDQGNGNSTRSPEAIRAERDFVLRYLGTDGREIHWDFIRLAMSSVADVAVFPMQDVLGLGSEARMNLPASTENNWTWRFEEHMLRREQSDRLREFSRSYGRNTPLLHR